jgi:hypothetical protein
MESSAAGPLSTLERERGTVTIRAIGEGRYDVQTPSHAQICGFDAAPVLAEQLSPAIDRG